MGSDTDAVQKGAIESVERTIANTVLTPGETTTVTVTAEFSQEVDPSIIEQFDQAVSNVALSEVVPETDLSAVRGNKEILTVHKGENSTTLSYEVTVPMDATHGESFMIDGLLETEGTETVVPGDATIEVVDSGDGPPPLPNKENRPRDIDGDGRFEDIDGDGEFDIFDVQALFEGLNSDPVQNNPAAFNFNDDDNPEEEGVTIFDVQGLFELLD